jgi:hypothetical protein
MTVTMDSFGTCQVSILFKEIETHHLLINEAFDVEAFTAILTKLCKAQFCSGIATELTRGSIAQKLQYHSVPFPRYNSRTCPVLLPQLETKKQTHCCLQCRLLTAQIKTYRKRKTMLKSKTLKNSCVKTGQLSPNIRRKQMQKLRNQRHALKKKLAALENKLKEHEMDLSDNQSEELTAIVQTINDNYENDLQEVINQNSPDSEFRDVLVKSWETDSKRQHSKDSTNFFNDQVKNKTGSRSNRWSIITYRMAPAVYTRSHAAYEALRSFHILNLPSVNSLQGKTGKFLDAPGINHHYLQEQSTKYKQFQSKKQQ